jgi:tetratricopeptide (TPR) repeat protein
MLEFMKRARAAIDVRRLKRQEPHDRTPRSTIRLCRLYEQLGRFQDSVQAARRGLERYPHAHELEDVLRRGFERCKTDASLGRPAASPGELAELVRAYLEFARLDEAARAGRALAKARPDDAEARLLHGRACFALFQRDHAARDGSEALESFKRAVELAPESFVIRRSLAEVYFAIGATSQALFHLLLALEIDPRDKIANRLYMQLRRLPFQRRAEKDLLWETEINDQPLVQTKTKPLDSRYGELIRTGVRQLSGMDGVRRVAMRHRGVAIVARNGGEAHAASADTDAFLASAEHLRKAGSAWAKRIGMGGFEEATLSLDDAMVFAVAAAGSVLAIEIEPDRDPYEVSEEARTLLASWTGSRYRDLEWVR